MISITLKARKYMITHINRRPYQQSERVMCWLSQTPDLTPDYQTPEYYMTEDLCRIMPQCQQISKYVL